MSASFPSLIQVGACLVDKNKMIVGFGYNGFPLKIDDKDPKVNWDDKEEKQKVGEPCQTLQLCCSY
jgi:deoxycytidylate deaminase